MTFALKDEKHYEAQGIFSVKYMYLCILSQIGCILNNELNFQDKINKGFYLRDWGNEWKQY